eukprot:TRINITY_DN70466_c0_g1_i1.p1 TRINITY_DN70466_c0_g1~~TRINITY_DN70466_c0_g1_i1.p1  ORF type:complete len:291 (+),score=43.58 TRINITY_DN70466_c0_g1_i1:41-874(+)
MTFECADSCRVTNDTAIASACDAGADEDVDLALEDFSGWRAGLPPPQSQKASRSYTIFAALQRFASVGCGVSSLPQVVVLHIVGAGSVEAAGGFKGTAAMFRPLVDLLRRRHGWRGELQLLLVGPEIDPRLDDRLVHREQAVCACMAVAYRHGAYSGEEVSIFGRPLAVFLFNAGVWGYDSWLPTLHVLASLEGVPAVVTSYNWHEADDDQGVLENIFPAEAWRWEPEANPFASMCTTQAVAPPCRERQDNGYWQTVCNALKTPRDLLSQDRHTSTT